MPDILIRGMEMPTEGGAIGIYKISGNFYAARVGKDELFPLVELPPHGDLISKQAALAALYSDYAYAAMEIIEKEVPVVVPASEEGSK